MGENFVKIFEFPISEQQADVSDDIDDAKWSLQKIVKGQSSDPHIFLFYCLSRGWFYSLVTREFKTMAKKIEELEEKVMVNTQVLKIGMGKQDI